MDNLTLHKLSDDLGVIKLALDPHKFTIVASVQCESPVAYHVSFEDSSEQVGKSFKFAEYSHVLMFTEKVLPILEVAKRTDNALIKLYDEKYSVEYCGGFTCVASLLFMDIEDYCTDAILGGHSISDYTTYMTYSYLENAWDHYEDLGVFLEDRRCVDAFLESQYILNKEI